ncbi:MAG: C25 family cysteine peptidase [Bacteroidota bacterium]
MRFQSVFLWVTLCLIASKSLGQPYGNEWINFSQEYFKIPTAQNGVYRIQFDQLVDAGVPVDQVISSRYQMFHRGQQVAIRTNRAPNQTLREGDVIEFYGVRNDGTLDRELYVEPAAQPHSFFNIFSDTTAFFLTYSLSGETGLRIEDVDIFNVDNLPVEPFVFEEQSIQNVENYSLGQTYPLGLGAAETHLSAFDFGEGWTGTSISEGNSGDFTFLNLGDQAASGPNPRLDIVVVGRSNFLNHNVDLLIGPSESQLRLFKNLRFDFETSVSISDDIQFSDIGADGSMLLRLVVNSNDNASNTSRVSLSHRLLSFPGDQDLEGLPSFFKTPENPLGESFLSLSNAPEFSSIWDVTNVSNVRTVSFTEVSGNLEFVLDQTEQERTLFVTNSVLSSTVERVDFRSFNPSNLDYYIITNELLRLPGAIYNDPVQEYANYRSSVAGGSFSVGLFNINELYDQFSFGENTPLALYRFSEFVLDNGNPEYLFLVGKALTINLGNGTLRNNPASLPLNNLVPTGGVPGSDAVFSSGLEGTTFEPALPVGRLVARTPIDVEAYLEKIRVADAFNFDDLWKKRILHLSGGLTQNELVQFRLFLDDFEQTAVGDFLGGDVTTIGKTTTANVELINVNEIVNEGIGLITFYGHSAAQLTDIDIGEVSDPQLGYNNTDLYTVILVNGCNAGGIFDLTRTFGEDWILTPQLGAVGFLAHATTGFVSPLRLHSDIFYEVGYGDQNFIGTKLADIHKETSTRFLARFGSSERNIAQVQQVVLQGDPAVTLFGENRPDYSIESDDLFLESFNNNTVTAQTDSFQLAMVVTNFGATDPDSVNVKVSRRLASNQVIELASVFFAPILFEDTLLFTVSNVGIDAFGLNEFTVQIDAVDSVEEISETNNTAVFSTFINQGGTKNLSPYEFEVIQENSPVLISQSNNILDNERGFMFELDTVSSFNSPFKRSTEMQAEVLAEWQIPVSLVENQEYYWRSRFSEASNDEDTAWSESSFVFINNSEEGWLQSDVSQLNENNLNGLEFNQGGTLEFETNETSVSVLTGGSNNPGTTQNIGTSLVINGTQFIVDFPDAENTRLCRNNTLLAIAFDQASTIPFAVLENGNFDVLDPLRCGLTPQVINNFTQADIINGRLDEYLDLLPNGDFVLFFNLNLVQYSSFSPGLISRLENAGASATTIANLSDGDPYILLGQQGVGSGNGTEIIANDGVIPDSEEQITLNQTVFGRFTQGSITSPLIGPVKRWINFESETQSLESPSSDFFAFDVIGFDNSGNEVSLLENQTSPNVDLSAIDANQFPVIQLRYETGDAVNLTPAQLRRWVVFYEGVPEIVLLKPEREGNNALELTLEEGTVFETDFVIRNVSDNAFQDSISITSSLINRTSGGIGEQIFNIAPLQAEQSINFSLEIETLGRPGSNDLFLNINEPVNELDRVINNNIASIPNYLTVNADQTNPVLDVTFDGRYILDGDIVSPSPVIQVTLRDDNSQLFQSDTSGVSLFIRAPEEGSQFERVSFNDPNVNFVPASEEQNLSVTYNPQGLADGTYTFRAQAEDASGNQSGSEPFTISFEVINESTITNFYPYPNPFSTSCRFVFTLTGSDIPDQVKIQIMTVSGKVVREILQDELGPIRIGNNITEFAWDGRDEYGDRLANGVYLYRAIVRSNGQGIDNRPTEGDRGFKRGFGKLYILR